jgi:hypothetical protein
MSGPWDIGFGWAISWVWSHVFRFRPRISTEGGRLVARSGMRAKVMSLGAWTRVVTVDPQERMVRIRGRAAWVFPLARAIPFDRIDEVLYSYGDYGAASDWSAHQETDVYTVGLLLQGGEEVKLFRFYGAGGFANDGTWPDWFYWDEIIQSRMTAKPNDDESLHFADVLAALIGVPIGAPPA